MPRPINATTPQYSKADPVGDGLRMANMEITINPIGPNWTTNLSGVLKTRSVTGGTVPAM